jgi:hypothetical protein
MIAVLILQAKIATQTGFDPVNFVSYFSILSSIGAAGILACLAVKPSLVTSPRFTVARGAVTLSMCGVGLLFMALLARSPGEALRHLVGPLLILADWALDPPPRMRYRSTAAWLGFPALYFVYTLVRGHFVGWYPYGFMAPTPDSGYWGVLGFAIMVGSVLTVVALLLARRAAATPAEGEDITTPIATPSLVRSS